MFFPTSSLFLWRFSNRNPSLIYLSSSNRSIQNFQWESISALSLVACIIVHLFLCYRCIRTTNAYQVLVLLMDHVSEIVYWFTKPFLSHPYDKFVLNLLMGTSPRTTKLWIQSFRRVNVSAWVPVEIVLVHSLIEKEELREIHEL